MNNFKKKYFMIKFDGKIFSQNNLDNCVDTTKSKLHKPWPGTFGSCLNCNKFVILILRKIENKITFIDIDNNNEYIWKFAYSGGYDIQNDCNEYYYSNDENLIFIKLAVYNNLYIIYARILSNNDNIDACSDEDWIEVARF